MNEVDRNRFIRDLERVPVIAILRGVTPETVVPVCEALYEGGIRFIEVTLNSVEPLESIRKAAAHFAGRDVRVGAGTVLRPEDVDRVADVGGLYIISPNFNPAVVERTRKLGLISIPGIMTPTEAFTATDAGADLLKVFPASRFGPGYLNDLKAVLPTPLIAVGGVKRNDLLDYLRIAVAVGVGSSVYSPSWSPQEITQHTAEYMAVLNAMR